MANSEHPSLTAVPFAQEIDVTPPNEPRAADNAPTNSCRPCLCPSKKKISPSPQGAKSETAEENEFLSATETDNIKSTHARWCGCFEREETSREHNPSSTRLTSVWTVKSTQSDMFPLLTQKFFTNTFRVLDNACKEEKADQLLHLSDVFQFWSRGKSCGFGKTYIVTCLNARVKNDLMMLKIVQKGSRLAVNSIRNEVTSLRKLHDLPFFRNIQGTFQTKIGFCMTTGFNDKMTMLGLVETAGKLHENHIRFYAAEIVCAIGFLHGSGIIHRSLSASNISLDFEGHVVLFDLGFVTFLPSTDLALFDGPPYDFIAPEMVKGELYTKNVDWWALGVLIYYFMHSRMPFASVNGIDTLFKILEFQPLFVGKEEDRFLTELCRSLLTKDPLSRLGNGIPDADRIKEHAFFSGIDWSKVAAREAQPPPIPEGIPFPYATSSTPRIFKSFQQDENLPSSSQNLLINQYSSSSRSSSSASYRQVHWRDSIDQDLDFRHCDDDSLITDPRKYSSGLDIQRESLKASGKISVGRFAELELLKHELKLSRRFSVSESRIKSRNPSYAALRISSSRSSLQPTRKNSFSFQMNNNSIFDCNFLEKSTDQQVLRGIPRSLSEPILPLPQRLSEKSVLKSTGKYFSFSISEPLLCPQVVEEEDQCIIQDSWLESPEMPRTKHPILLKTYFNETEKRGSMKQDDIPIFETVGKSFKTKQDVNVQLFKDSNAVQRAEETKDNHHNLNIPYKDSLPATLSKKTSAVNVKMKLDAKTHICDLEQNQHIGESLPFTNTISQTERNRGVRCSRVNFIRTDSRGNIFNDLAGTGIGREESNNKVTVIKEEDAKYTDTSKKFTAEKFHLSGLNYRLGPFNELSDAPSLNRRLSIDLQPPILAAVDGQSKSTGKRSFGTKLKHSIPRVKSLIKYFSYKRTNARPKTAETKPAEQQNGVFSLDNRQCSKIKGISSQGNSTCDIQPIQYLGQQSTDGAGITFNVKRYNSEPHPFSSPYETKQTFFDVVGEILVPTSFLDLFVCKTRPKALTSLKWLVLHSEEKYRRICNSTKSEQKAKLSRCLSQSDQSFSVSSKTQNEAHDSHFSANCYEETTFPASSHASPLTAHKYFKPVWQKRGLISQEIPRMLFVANNLDTKTDLNADNIHSFNILGSSRKMFSVWRKLTSKNIIKKKEDFYSHDFDQIRSCTTHIGPYHLRGKVAIKSGEDDMILSLCEVPNLKTLGTAQKNIAMKKYRAGTSYYPDSSSDNYFAKSNFISAKLHDNDAQEPEKCVSSGNNYQVNPLCGFALDKVQADSTSLNECGFSDVKDQNKTKVHDDSDDNPLAAQNVCQTTDILESCENTLTTYHRTVLKAASSNENKKEKVEESKASTNCTNDTTSFPSVNPIQHHFLESAKCLDTHTANISPHGDIVSKERLNEPLSLTIQKAQVQEKATLISSAKAFNLESQSQISTPVSESIECPVRSILYSSDFSSTSLVSVLPRKSKSCQSQVSKNLFHKTYSFSSGTIDSHTNPPDLSPTGRKHFENHWDSKSSSVYSSVQGKYAQPTRSARVRARNVIDTPVYKKYHIDKVLENSAKISGPGISITKKDFFVSTQDSNDANEDRKCNKDYDGNVDETLEELQKRYARALKAKERLMADADTIELWETWQCPFYSQRFCGDGSGGSDLGNMPFSIPIQRAKTPREPDSSHHGQVVGTFTLEYTKPPVEGFVVLG